MKQLKVVCAVIVNEEGKILACQRGYGDYKGFYEFPGGKIEAGEDPKDALIREIKEEFDSEIKVGNYIDTIEYDYPEFHISLNAYYARVVKGDLKLLEHLDKKWCKRSQLLELKWCPADELIVKNYLLPRE